MNIAIPLPFPCVARTRPSLRRDDGYTLMELLVVLAILGLLAAIGAPIVLRYLDTARVSTAKTQLSSLSAGLEEFKFDIGRYPTTQEGLDALLKAPPGLDDWHGPYLKKQTATTDPWGHPYHYKSPGEHGDFDIYSFGPTAEQSAGAIKPPVANW
jgi:general secretion pathway protein G